MGSKRKSASKRRNNNSQEDFASSSSSILTNRQQQQSTENDSADDQQETTSTIVNNNPPVLLAAEKSGKKWRNMATRTFTTLLMIGAFLFVLASGYIWSIVAVMAITTAVYREVIQIAHVPAKEKSVRWFKTMSWYVSSISGRVGTKK